MNTETECYDIIIITTAPRSRFPYLFLSRISSLLLKLFATDQIRSSQGFPLSNWESTSKIVNAGFHCFYSCTFIVWFLIRFHRGNRKKKNENEQSRLGSQGHARKELCIWVTDMYVGGVSVVFPASPTLRWTRSRSTAGRVAASRFSIRLATSFLSTPALWGY